MTENRANSIWGAPYCLNFFRPDFGLIGAWIAATHGFELAQATRNGPADIHSYILNFHTWCSWAVSSTPFTPWGKQPGIIISVPTELRSQLPSRPGVDGWTISHLNHKSLELDRTYFLGSLTVLPRSETKSIEGGMTGDAARLTRDLLNQN